MSSNPPKSLTHSFTFRLSLGYSALFTFSAAILFGLLYLLLASTLQRKDQEVIEARLRECAAVYDNGGLAALQGLVQRSRDSDKEKSFFIRLARQQGSEDWTQAVDLVKECRDLGDGGGSDVRRGNLHSEANGFAIRVEHLEQLEHVGGIGFRKRKRIVRRGRSERELTSEIAIEELHHLAVFLAGCLIRQHLAARAQGVLQRIPEAHERELKRRNRR